MNKQISNFMILQDGATIMLGGFGLNGIPENCNYST